MVGSKLGDLSICLDPCRGGFSSDIQISNRPQGQHLEKKSIIVVMPSLDLGIPWGFFNGGSKGYLTLGGAGTILFLSPSHYFHLKYDMGWGSNNKVEFFTLCLLNMSTKQKGHRKIYVMGDSKLVIN